MGVARVRMKKDGVKWFRIYLHILNIGIQRVFLVQIVR